MIEPNNPKNCSNAIVTMLENHGVTHVFGIPGAKIDSLFVALKHSKIKLILCQHEQNAAFMAAAFGRLTGKVRGGLTTLDSLSRKISESH